VITFLVVVMTWGSIPLRLRLRALLLAVLLVGAGAAFVIWRADQLRALFADVSGPGARDIVIRTTLIRRAFQVFLEHPWVGVGYGEYFAYSTAPAAITNVDVYVGSAHNGVMMVLAEMGVLGTVCFALMAFGILRRARQGCLRSPDDFTRGATTAVFAFLVVSFLVHFIGNSALLPIPQERVAAENAFLLWLLIGLSAGIAEVNEVRKAKPAKRKFWLARPARSLAGRRRIAAITHAQARAPL
jgi:O-antigen ligase